MNKVQEALDIDESIGLYDVKGWLNKDDATLLHDCALEAPTAMALELGTFCGRSAFVIAHAFRSRGGGTVLCSDTFPADRDFRGHSIPSVHEAFLSNTKALGYEDIILTMKGSHQRLFNMLHGSFGLIYVDGGHREEHVRLCIQHALRLLAPDGVLAFHDYGCPKFPDIQRVVDEFSRNSFVYNPIRANTVKAFTISGVRSSAA